MKRWRMILAILITILVVGAPLALAADNDVPGTIVIVNEPERTFTVKDMDGKEYQIDYDLYVGENLQTGDAVIVTMKDAQPVKVRKK